MPRLGLSRVRGRTATPTGELDQNTGAQILDLFEKLNAGGPTLVVVTHDAAAAARARGIVEMRDGMIVTESRRPS